MDDPNFSIPLAAINLFSALTCSILFYCYFKIPQRGLGLKMIMSLAISDFIFHISQIILILWENNLVQIIFSVPIESAFNFSLIWASNIAYFTFRFIHLDNIDDPPKFFLLSAIAIIIIAICTSLIGTLLGGAFIWGLIADIPAPFAIIMTLLLNLKSIAALTKASQHISEETKTTVKALYQYAFVQTLTVGPVTVYFLLRDVTNWELSVFSIVSAFLISFSGFANAMVYFFQRSNLTGGTNRRKNSEQTELSFSLHLDQKPGTDQVEPFYN